MNAVSPRGAARRAMLNAYSRIVLSSTNEGRLSRLATAATSWDSEMAERRHGEIALARLLTPRKVSPDVAEMQARLVNRDQVTRPVRCVRLVYPKEASINSGRVSVLTLLGAALGQEHVLTALGVSPQSFEAAKA